jgi:hypothetical protein
MLGGRATLGRHTARAAVEVSWQDDDGYHMQEALMSCGVDAD